MCPCRRFKIEMANKLECIDQIGDIAFIYFLLNIVIFKKEIISRDLEFNSRHVLSKSVFYLKSKFSQYFLSRVNKIQ